MPDDADAAGRHKEDQDAKRGVDSDSEVAEGEHVSDSETEDDASADKPKDPSN